MNQLESPFFSQFSHRNCWSSHIVRLQQDEQTSRLPTARRNSKAEVLHSVSDDASTGGQAAALGALLPRQRRRQPARWIVDAADAAPMPLAVVKSARRREQKTYTGGAVYANTPHSLHSHHPHVKLEISFKASHARDATPIRKLATALSSPRSRPPRGWYHERARARASRVATSRTPHVSGRVGPAEEEC